MKVETNRLKTARPVINIRGFGVRKCGGVTVFELQKDTGMDLPNP